jgi:hypothetical protein
MHTLLIGLYLTIAPPSHGGKVAPAPAPATTVDALKAIAVQAERLVRSGGYDLVDLNLVRELELAALKK